MYVSLLALSGAKICILYLIVYYTHSFTQKTIFKSLMSVIDRNTKIRVEIAKENAKIITRKNSLQLWADFINAIYISRCKVSIILDTYLAHATALAAQNKLLNLICSNLMSFSCPCHFCLLFFFFLFLITWSVQKETTQTGIWIWICIDYQYLTFVCVEVLWPSQPNVVMSSMVNLPNHTFTGQAYPSKWLTSILHILLPESDNCSLWISGRERMNIENISWSNLHARILLTQRGLNPQPPNYQSEAHPTEPPRRACTWDDSLCTL